MPPAQYLIVFFFFNDTATTEIYTLSLHDALPIYPARLGHRADRAIGVVHARRLQRRLQRQRSVRLPVSRLVIRRSEEHTSELQSLAYLVCRLLLEKKKTKKKHTQLIPKKKHYNSH